MSSSSTESLVRAAGLLIYRRRSSAIEYLLLQASYEPFHWTPPKGHVDPGEEEWVAALREVREEAGIDAVDKLEIHTEFKHEMFYTANSHGTTRINPQPKKVTYWLAKALDSELKITLSNEHKDWKWADLTTAIQLSKFDEMKKMLDDAQKFLETKGI